MRAHHLTVLLYVDYYLHCDFAKLVSSYVNCTQAVAQNISAINAGAWVSVVPGKEKNHWDVWDLPAK